MSINSRVIVIGGGIVGCSILYHLAKSGCRVNASLAVAWIDSNYREPGTTLQIDILGHRRTAQIVAEPLYDPQHVRLLG
ncbi:MAG: FAD-dependent oxidoreductase [Candidatus Azotimanducaceae bacterium WSBS_2022_MAG_OTU7]